MMKHLLLSAICLYALQSGAQTVSPSVEANEALQAKATMTALPELNLKGTTLATFMNVIRAGGTSGGIARVLDDCTHGPEKILMIPAGTTLSRALDGVAAEARSEWRVIDGVVDMLPGGAVPPLLEVRIHSFTWDKNASALESVARLAGSPEVIEKARQLGLEIGPYEHSASAVCIRNCSPEPKAEQSLQEEDNSTLLTLLNRIVQAHKGAVWAYSEHHCGEVTLFRLETVAE
jgi:hypothetical protein